MNKYFIISIIILLIALCGLFEIPYIGVAITGISVVSMLFILIDYVIKIKIIKQYNLYFTVEKLTSLQNTLENFTNEVKSMQLELKGFEKTTSSLN